MREKYRIGLAQIHSSLGNVRYNLTKHLDYIDKAKENSVDILVFPELSLTGYMMRDLFLEVSEICLKAVKELERNAGKMSILVGLVEEVRPGIYRNSLAIIAGGRFSGFIPKLYLPNYGLFEESRYFSRGNAKDLKVFEHEGLRFSAVICEDAWHPEPIELLSRKGAELIFIASSSPLRGLYGYGETFIERIWESIVITRAVENTAFIAFINRVGAEDEEYFWGGSMVVGPDGKMLARAKKMEEELLLTDIDIHLLRRARRFSSFKDHMAELHVHLSELP